MHTVHAQIAGKGTLTVRRITDEFVCSPECPICEGEGTVCEDHPDTRWHEGDPPCCGAGAGMPCPSIAGARDCW